MSLRRQFALALVVFALLLTAVGGFASWRLASDALEAEMEDKLRQVVGTAAAVGGYDASDFVELTPGEEASRFWRGRHTELRNLDAFVNGSWIFRRSDFSSVVTSQSADSIPIGTPLSVFASYRREISETARTGVVTSSPLHPGPGGELYKYGFIGLPPRSAELPSELVLAVRMRADYLEPLAVFRSRILQASFAGAILALVLAAILAGNVASPLERLSRAALRIQRGRWSEPVDEERGREMGRLSKAMERMRVGILRRDEQLRLMLAQVAHEIRNPLGGLELFASAAQDSDDADERNRILARMREEVDALNHIINDFLAFARPPEAVLRIHDVRDPLREAAELVAMEVCKTGKCVEVELPDEPLMARADPAHVKRVALNLLRNGAQAGNSVRLQAGLLRGEIRISVSDDGPGVPEELRDRIFEPFMTDKEQGAGLGLAIVSKVVEANRGRVELVGPDDDPVGEGAEFRVYLRSSDELPRAPREPTSSSP